MAALSVVKDSSIIGSEPCSELVNKGMKIKRLDINIFTHLRLNQKW